MDLGSIPGISNITRIYLHKYIIFKKKKTIFFLRTSAVALCASAAEYAVWERSAHAKQVDIALHNNNIL